DASLPGVEEFEQQKGDVMLQADGLDLSLNDVVVDILGIDSWGKEGTVAPVEAEHDRPVLDRRMLVRHLHVDEEGIARLDGAGPTFRKQKPAVSRLEIVVGDGGGTDGKWVRCR